MSPTPRRVGSGSASFDTQAERIISEAVRRARLSGNNAPPLVPGVDDASYILALRSFASTGTQGATTHGTLTFGAHLNGGSGFDGSADVLLETDATDAATPATLMARDASGFSALVQLILGDTGFVGDTGAGTLDIWPKHVGGHVRVQKHDFSATNLDIDDDGNMAVRANITCVDIVPSNNVAAGGGLGIFGNSPPAQAPVPTAAGATYGTTEQDLLNDIRLRLYNIGVYG